MIKCYFVVLLALDIAILQISCYSQVAKSGSIEVNGNSSTADSPRIHRAREGVANLDLLFPKV